MAAGCRPVAFALVAIAAILAGSAIYVFQSLRDLPGEAADQAGRMLRNIETLAEAFKQGTVQTTFTSHATTVTGSSYLQFATLRQTEVFTRKDEASILWGNLELPDVVVSATAPVEYTAYLDLDDTWHFELDGSTLRVVAPEIRFNKPNIDASRIRYEIREASILRDEAAALDQLKLGLTLMSIERSQEQIPLVRELGRRKTREFVQNWLGEAFGDGQDYRVQVLFADELESGLRNTGPGG